MYKYFYNIASVLILNEAKKRRIKVEIIYNELAEMSFKGHSEYLCAQSTSKTDAVARRICQDKKLAKICLELSDIPTAKGQVFTIDELNEAKQFIKENKICSTVVKPLSGRMGKNVFLDIHNSEELDRVWAEIADETDSFLVEEQFLGEEYRLLATREKFLAATKRVPANVVGDGVSTISQLVEKKNSDPRRQGGIHSPLKPIKFDSTALFNLKQSGLSPNHIPKKDEVIYIRKNSNISTGGDSIDFTDTIHDSVKEIAVAAVKAIPGLAYAGVDFMCKDITAEQKPSDYIIVEVNSSPGIGMHHFPYSGKPRNVAKDIVDVIFPETKTD